ncbi:MAG: translocation/assembly module TamB domain-containing protein [Candidatus Manganitrophus sp.]|nr:translocation/assembly module TamB domain-containing protein [Candidatus Manganitrophus sp.]
MSVSPETSPGSPWPSPPLPPFGDRYPRSPHLRSDHGGVRPKTGGAASSEATSLILSELLEGAVPKTGVVDRIQVDPFTGGAKSSSGPRLTAEKRLLEDRLLVTYSATLDPSQEQLIRMIYELGKNVSLVGERDQDGQMGGDVRFRFEFR